MRTKATRGLLIVALVAGFSVIPNSSALACPPPGELEDCGLGVVEDVKEDPGSLIRDPEAKAQYAAEVAQAMAAQIEQTLCEKIGGCP